MAVSAKCRARFANWSRIRSDKQTAYMTINWLFLLLSTVLLFPPLPVTGATRRFLKSRRNSSVKTPILFKRWQNWVDLARGFAGAFILSSFAITVLPDVKGAATKALMVQACVLGLGVLLQVVRVNAGIVLVAPIFLLTGITLVYGGWDAGGFAVFVGWMFAIGGKSPAYQLPVMAVALGGSGYLLGMNLGLILNCGLIALPLLASFLFHKPLAFVTDEPPSLPR